MEKTLLLKALKSEIELTTGCTDPGAVCLAVRRAARELGCTPERVIVTVSPNIYKNGINVGVPGTGMRGLGIAAALGAVIESLDSGLALFNNIAPGDVERATLLVNKGGVIIRHADTPSPLYIKAEVFSGPRKAHAVIRDDYTNIVEVSRDGEIISFPGQKQADMTRVALKDYPLKELFASIETMTSQDL